MPLLTGGCAAQFLRDQTTEMGPQIGSMEQKMVLANLGRLIDEPWSIPGHVDLASASLQNQDQVGISVKVPFHTPTRVADEADPSATVLQEQDSVNLTPVTDPDDMRRLQSLYRYAVCVPRNDQSGAYETLSEQWRTSENPGKVTITTTATEKVSRDGVKQLQNQISASIKIIDEFLATKPSDQRLANIATQSKSRLESINADLNNLKLTPEQAKIDQDKAIEEMATAKQFDTNAYISADKAASAAAKANVTSKATTKSSSTTTSPTSEQITQVIDNRLRNVPQGRWLYWTGGGSEPCDLTAAEVAPPPGAVDLGRYGHHDLWIMPNDDRFPRFVISALGAIPNTVGYPAVPELASKASLNAGRCIARGVVICQ